MRLSILWKPAQKIGSGNDLPMFENSRLPLMKINRHKEILLAFIAVFVLPACFCFGRKTPPVFTDMSSLKLGWSYHREDRSFQDIAIDRDNNHIAIIGQGGGIHVFSLDNGEVICEIVPKRGTDFVTRATNSYISFDVEGNLLATVAEGDTNVDIFDMTDCARTRVSVYQERISGISKNNLVFQSNKLVAAQSFKGVIAYELPEMEILWWVMGREFTGARASTYRMASIGDSVYVWETREMKRLDVASGEELWALDLRAEEYFLIIRTFLYTNADETLGIIAGRQGQDLESRQLVAILDLDTGVVKKIYHDREILNREENLDNNFLVMRQTVPSRSTELVDLTTLETKWVSDVGGESVFYKDYVVVLSGSGFELLFLDISTGELVFTEKIQPARDVFDVQGIYSWNDMLLILGKNWLAVYK
jgi:hypothetical protein